jgi:hypothetical protein
MHRHIRLLLTSLAATAILAAAVGTASANNLSVSNQQIRVTWSGLELTNNITTGTVRCPVTLEGSFHSATIRKVSRALIGYISRAAVGLAAQCTGGRATINQETLPWHLAYDSFRGALPRIEEITLLLIRASFIVTPNEGNSCRATTTIENPAAGRAIRNTTTGAITGLRADESRAIPLVNAPGGIFCGLGEGRFSGLGNVALLGTAATAISVRLI